MSTPRRHRLDVARAYGSIVKAQQLPVVGRLIRVVLFVLIGIDIPRSVRIGDGLRIMHGGHGIVVHRNTTIGDNVTLYHQVTLGLADLRSDDGTTGFAIGDGAMLTAGAKILAPRGTTLEIGRNAVVGANAVLLESVGPGELWVGNPARAVTPRRAK